MSLILSGYHIETKPAHPRSDIVSGTSGITPAEQTYSYKMYNGDLGAKIDGDYAISIAFADDLVRDRQPKPQTLHTTILQLRDYLRESVSKISRSATNRFGYFLAIDPVVGKSSLVWVQVPSKVGEADLLPGYVHLIFSLQPADNLGKEVDWSGGLIRNVITRMAELAREKDYYWQDEMARLLAPVGGAYDQGDTMTVVAPTWLIPPAGTETPIAFWVKDGIAITPLADGTANYVVTPVQPSDAGNYQVKIGIPVRAGYSPAQWRTSEIAVITVNPATIIVTETGLDAVAAEDGTLMIVEQGG